LSDYADALEDWDWEETVGDGWDIPDVPYLDPDPWIHDHPVYVERQEKVTSILDSSYDKAQRFLARFQPLLETYWRNKQFDINILVNDLVKNPVEMLTNTIRLLKYYNQHFASNLPASTDIGLLQLDSKIIKEKLLPTPKAILEDIEKLVPVVNKARMESSTQWLEVSLTNLKKNVDNVEEFVV